ncbi:SDR family mycofactocin-dependent oxidoreductase [Prauserella marina]|uniref:SDR family mycofactocin-dependent oxidoreductase n=2 Tax=Prauserella marina TaxID=530584 RepID=A0A222VL08_9PSEU|nr:SDR family mycofactocin-dependent oxidoreductase [Prauserella marina]PWV85754.1 SDR family mycofactocin-dependent oxidoreductase [Prauserella marina]SDC46455.1 SDR family mycofactocin-dependent oxidoreductase [Prauserella marina]
MSQPRTALVTGAARGIGAAAVRRLADTGWNVVALDRAEDDPSVPYPLGTRKQLAELAAPYQGAVHDVVADVRDLARLTEAVALAEERFGGLDAAVAAAALMAGGAPLWESDDTEWDALFSVGVQGVANLARAAIPALLRRPEPRHGRFVALASAAAHNGLWHLAGYNAAKHAVVGLVKGLATDLRGTGICATAVSPGSTRTDMLTATAALYDLTDVEEFAKHQLVGRLLEPDEIAATIAFLCSPDSSAITGSVIHADGGFTT